MNSFHDMSRKEPRGIIQEQPRAQSDIHWKKPTIMIACFFLSVSTAVGHHFFYMYLDGRPVSHQAWYTRAGIALASIMKILLAVSISTSFTQRIWRTVRKRSLPLKSVDGLFSATSDPLSLFDGRLLRHAKLAMLLGILIW